jgi:phospholipid/cholesterol/gamma-HCH transport system ATP-binding protein
METESEIIKPENNISREEPAIVIEHLRKSFDDHVVLEDINLSVNKAENLVVLGKSGSGKSVLIKCVIGLMKPDSGILRVMGHEIGEMNSEKLNDLRRNIGFLFQSGALYDSMTVKENLEFPLTRNKKNQVHGNMKQLVEEALEDVGLPDAINKMPAELSGGMRKRIGLARTFILKPAIMLYDEPTTGLDPVTSSEISSLIVKMQKKYKTTSIIITHDIPCAKITSNRMVILKKGVFAAEGTYDELSSSNDPWVNAFFKT